MLPPWIKPSVLVLTFLCVGLVSGQVPVGGSASGEEVPVPVPVPVVEGSDDKPGVKNPLPLEFLDHQHPHPPTPPGGQGDANTVPVHKDHVVRMLIGGLKAGGDSLEQCDRQGAVKELEDSASKAFGSKDKAARFVRAIANKLNATCDEIKQVASNLKKTEDETHANAVRRAVEDAAVLGSGNTASPSAAPSAAGQSPNVNRIVEFSVFRGFPPAGGVGGGRLPTLFGGGTGFNPFLGGGGNNQVGGFGEGPPGPFRFGGGNNGNPFFSVPMTSPALDMDLDRLMFISTPVLGITGAFTLTKALHDLQSPRSEVFQLQEQFQSKNLTESDAAQILADYENKVKVQTSSSSAPPSTPPSTILHNTAELAGLNATEAKRFARAISQTIGPTLNSTQALEIHHAVRDLSKSQMNGLTDEIEKIGQGTTTPDGATGHDWIFSNQSASNSIEGPGGKRSLLNSLESSTRMFSSERACGFSIETDRGVLYPWVATLSCNRIQCTGSLISSSLIVTSASCILSCGTDAVRVTLGDNRLLKTLEVLAESAVVHPSFQSARDPQFDIGLVKLISPIDFNLNPLIYPICVVGVETDDPSIECEVVLGGQYHQAQTPFQKSVVSCFQPGNNVCSSNGILQRIACVRLNNCISISSQPSVPVICRRMNQVPARYYQWGVTTSDHHAPGGSVCFNGVARISDAISFLASGLN